MQKNNNGQDFITCKSCGSNKITLVGNIYYIIASASFLSIFFLLWLPIIGWIAIPIVLIISIVSLIIGFASKKSRVKCAACNNCFNISKVNYKKLKNLLKG